MRSLIPAVPSSAALLILMAGLTIPPSSSHLRVVEAAQCTNKGSLTTWSANTYTGICSDADYVYGVSSAGIDRIASDGTVVTLDSTTATSTPSSGVPKYLANCERFGDMLLLQYEDNAAIWSTEICSTTNCIGTFTKRVANDFDVWDDYGESGNAGVCTGGSGTNSKLFGLSGNLIQDPSTGSMYLIGQWCKTIWKIDNTMLNTGEWRGTRVAGTIQSAGTTDNADALLATMDTARFGAYLNGNIYFLDTNGLRKFGIADGSMTSLSNSPAFSGFTVGLNTAAKIAYTATTSNVVSLGNVLYINDQVNHVVWGVDFSDDSSLSFDTLVGGSPTALGSGATDGAASVAKLDTPAVISPMGLNKLAVMDANGVRQVTGASCYSTAVGTNKGSIATTSATTDTVFCSDGTNLYVGYTALVKIAPDGTQTTFMASAEWTNPGDGSTMYKLRHCDVFGERLYATFEIGSPVASVPLSAPGAWSHNHATDYDQDNYNGEATDPNRCIGGTGTFAQTFGLVGNLMKSADPTILRLYLIGSDCKVIWEIDINPSNNQWTSSIVAGTALSAGTTDAATATSATLDGGRFGTFFNNAIYFLDSNGLRRYAIGGAVTTLASSPGYAGYSAGLNSVAKIQYTADSSSLVMVGNNMFVLDEVNHAVHVADMSDEANLVWAPYIGGWPTALGAGATNGAASVAQLNTPKMMKAHGGSGGSVALMDTNGVRVLSGIPLTCVDALPNAGTGTCDALTTCTASQYESTAPTAFTDRVCTALTACTSTEYETTAATATSNRGCSALTVCTSGTHYESVAATSTTDRTCTAYTVVCTSTEYESTARSATSDRVCSTITTTCTSSEYESSAPTATNDRVCSAISSCTATQYETAAPTTTSDRVCATISTCSSSQYETTAPTTTSDRVCTALTVCSSSQYESTAATTTTDRVCTNLIVCVSPEVEITAPTATSQRVCGAATSTAAGSSSTGGTTTTTVAGASAPPGSTSGNGASPTTSAQASNTNSVSATTSSSSSAAGDVDLEGQGAGPAAAITTDGGLTGGQKAGISIGVILIIIAIVAIVAFAVWRLKMSKKNKKGDDLDNCEGEDGKAKNPRVSPVPEKALKYSPQETSMFAEEV